MGKRLVNLLENLRYVIKSSKKFIKWDCEITSVRNGFYRGNITSRYLLAKFEIFLKKSQNPNHFKRNKYVKTALHNTNFKISLMMF